MVIGDEGSLTKEIPTKTIKYTIHLVPPQGFYKISVSKGPVPKALKGLFTEMYLAEKKVQEYLAQVGKEETKE